MVSLFLQIPYFDKQTHNVYTASDAAQYIHFLMKEIYFIKCKDIGQSKTFSN